MSMTFVSDKCRFLLSPLYMSNKAKEREIDALPEILMAFSDACHERLSVLMSLKEGR